MPDPGLNISGLYHEAADLGWGWSQLELVILQQFGGDASGVDAAWASLSTMQRWAANPIFAAEMFQRFQLGDKLPKNEVEAAKWLHELEPKRQALAIAELICKLLLPEDGPVLDDEAEKWFTKLVRLKPFPETAGTKLVDAARKLGLGDTFSSPPREKAPAKAVLWLQRAALMDCKYAMHELGGHYADGYLVEKDLGLARHWYKLAADSGDAVSQWYYGVFLEKQGEKAAAASYYRQAMDGGEDVAVSDLADLLAAGGDGLPKNDAEANRLYSLDATSGKLKSFRSAVVLRWRLQKGLGTPTSNGEAAEWQRKIEEEMANGDDSHRKSLIFLLWETFEKEPFLDKEEAYRWMRRAADMGDRLAVMRLAYSKAPPNAKDESLESLLKLAGQGNTFAMSSLGDRYSIGDGVKKDQKEAFRWYSRGAEAGDRWAQRETGLRYLNGNGVAKDPSAAFSWFKKAAEQKEARSMFLVGQSYQKGDGVRKNTSEAMRWFERAGSAGDVQAMFELSLAYAVGEIVPRDNVKAYGWVNVAVARADTNEIRKILVEIRGRIENTASKGQIAEGQELSRTITAGIQRFYASLASPNQSVQPGPQARGREMGTAWAVTADGCLVTCAHVVSEGAVIHVTSTAGKTMTATLLKLDKDRDLALLRIDATTTPLALEFSAEAGDKVATMGFPNALIQGREPKLTEGIISSTSGLNDDRTALQISVPVQPGNSGGPLLNMNGHVVGVVRARLSDLGELRRSGSLPQTVNFAIKIQGIEPLLDAASGWQRAKSDAAAAPLPLPVIAKGVRASLYLVEADSG